MEHTGRILFAAFLTLSTAGTALAAPRVDRGPRDTYVLQLGNSTNVSGSLEDLGTLRRRYSGDFLWFRRGAAAYVIRDPRLLAEADAFFEPLRKLQPEQDSVARREAALDREDEEHDREEEAIEAEEETRSSPELDHRRRALDDRHRDLSHRQRELAKEERALDRREEALEEEAERELWRFLDRTVASGAARLASGK
ncbi:MAG: hypothetical protein WEB59_01610 [Thermoanaerobaculia bacterium]